MNAFSAIDVAAYLSKLTRSNESLFEESLKAADYSTLLANHPHQLERGAYAVPLVTSLINDGEYEAAAHLAGAYESGQLESCSKFTIKGISFHRLALDWLNAGKTITRFATTHR